MAHILIVEDEEDVALLLMHRLKRAGYDVTSRPDGESGLEAALTLCPDLVLLDWMLPGRSGIDVCAAVRANPETATTPVIMLTARTQSSDVDQATAAGANDYIIKPFGAKDLLDRIEALLPA